MILTCAPARRQSYEEDWIDFQEAQFDGFPARL